MATVLMDQYRDRVRPGPNRDRDYATKRRCLHQLIRLIESAAISILN